MTWIRMHKIISTCFGIGYLKGGGTYAALLYVITRYLTRAGGNNIPAQLTVFLVIFIVGVWSSFVVEKEWGKDSSKVVIDEVAGMCITLLFVTVTWQHVLAGFILFRFFDIVKPLYLKKLEYLPGGWGVMLDDIGAGLYAHMILTIMIAGQLF